MSRLLLLLLLLWSVPAPAAAFDPFTAAGIDRRPNAVVPLDLPFVDADGMSITLREIADGKPLLLVPVLHACPNICAVTLAGLAQAIEAQAFAPGRDFALISFGIDPKEGPPEAAAELAKLHRNFPDMRPAHSLTGTAENVAAVTDALGYHYAWDDQIGQYDHAAAVATLTPDGRLARWLYGLSPDPTDLHLALTEAGRGQIGTWTDQVLLFCYHFDPKTGRYGPLIWTIMRIAGAATAAALLALIGLGFLRDRRTKEAGR